MKKKVVLKDIAKEVGVSIATVSYVLSNGKDGRIGKEVTAKIKKVAKELDYQPNLIAKSLKSGKTNTIGLIVTDLSNPFYAHIARIIEDEVTQLGYTLMVSSSDEKAEKSWNLIKFLMHRQVDGFIIVPTAESEDQIEHLKEKKIPFVLIDRYFPEIPSHHVVVDNYTSAYKVVENLIQTGNTKIGILTQGNSLSHMKERTRGAIAAMEKHHLTINPTWLKEINFDSVEEDIAKGIEDLLTGDDPVTAIFFASNSLAIPGIKKVNHLGLKVPTDITIASFDQGEAFDLYYSPITYVHQPLSDLGKEAVHILTTEIASPGSGYQQVNLNAKMVVKESSRKDLIF
ncbi:LacI family DNA-binding transcriptional regulator [Flagellimonas amoyensis]|uniref:LacI family DNA-binding transcriptional regulator n=1 Tax=Flagellimonas amoyensis TaxID=2169401 RepID=UPI000D3A3088|nr:LacI family DNA-binding transcriptional regulator [Allomuricauda amoyensis]